MRARAPSHRRGLLLAALVAAVVAVPSVGTLASPRASADTTDQSSCPDSNPPNELTLGGGTPQTAQLRHAL